MQLTVVDHPLAAARLARIRDRRTDRGDFRRALEDLTRFLIYEALRDQPVVMTDIDTPMGPTKGARVAEPPLVVPVMRAGLGMLHATLDLLPNARTGFVGLRRDEETLLPSAYVNTVPEDLGGQSVIIIDPMLATGGSLIHTAELLVEAGAGALIAVCVLVAPEGVAAIEASGLPLTLVTASVDDRLNEVGFIVPGLGDAGDRQFGLA
jgi:uracil phosphoribosyltransferase